MMRQGVFIDRSGESHDVYILENKGYYRLDICVPGSDFHTQPGGVEYSIVKRKKNYTYGNADLYTEYNDLANIPNIINVPMDKSSYWDKGKFYSKSIQAKADGSYLYEIVQCNGKADSTTIKYGNQLLTITTLNDYSDMKLDPLNFSEYQEVQLSGAAIEGFTTPFYPLSVLRARYDIRHLEDMDFVVASDLETARKRLKEYETSDEPFRGFDTETTGLDVDLYGKDEMVGIVLSYSETNSTYYPFRMKEIPNLPMEFLAELMAVVLKLQDRTVAHFGKYDRKVMFREGYDVRVKYDTQILSFMQNAIIEKGLHGLKHIMQKLNGKKYLELSDIFISERLIEFAILPEDIVRLYACPDASSVIAALKALWKKLPIYTRKLFEVECQLSHIKADQEYWGLKVDVKKFTEGLDNCDYVLDQLMKRLRDVTKIDGNINSNAVLSNLMYNQLNCPILMRTKTGKPSTGAAAVKKLAKAKAEDASVILYDTNIIDKHGNVIIAADDINKAKYPALVVLEKYRLYMKLRTAFYSRFERTVNSGRIFFWVNANGAASGRQSSPMHQLPEEMKEFIIPDYDECNMWDPDYSQIELRMIAYLAGEKDLIALCGDPEKDIHRVIGSLITGKEMWEISAEERKKDKSRNFGVVYLISEFGLSNQMFGAGASENPEQVKKAKDSLNDFYKRFKRIRKYIADNGDIVKKNGFITTKFGRVRPFPEIFDPDISSAMKASIIRKANNTPVQGTAADYLKIAEVNFDTYIRSKGWNKISEYGFPFVRVALSIHDEVMLMTHPSIDFEEVLKMIKLCMEIPIEGAPPFFCSPALVDTWADHSNDALACPILLRDKLIANYEKTGISVLSKTNYLDTMNSYRDGLLRDYMKGLMDKYGTDPTIVCQHVRHPTLTHSLISQYKECKKLSHLDAIAKATELYIKGKEKDSEEEKKIIDLSFLDDEPLVNFNEEGEVVFDSPEEEQEYNTAPVDEEDVKFIEELSYSDLVYVWELGDAMCIDVTSLVVSEINSVIQEVWKYKDEEGFFKVLLYLKDKIVDTGFKVEDLPRRELNNYIKGLRERPAS